MLAQTVRNNLKNAKDLNIRTKATKFSNLFQSVPSSSEADPEIRQVLMKAGLVNVKEDDLIFDEISIPETIDIVEDTDDITCDEINDYIVENPNEVRVEFPIKSVIQLEEKLPFFKSISKKLESFEIKICEMQPQA